MSVCADGAGDAADAGDGPEETAAGTPSGDQQIGLNPPGGAEETAAGRLFEGQQLAPPPASQGS